MKLKEMENTAVIINTPEEYDKYVCMCAGHGWKFMAARALFSAELELHGSMYLRINSTDWGTVSGNVYNRTLITLAEFKKEQGIMKYSAGDVLVSKSGNEKKVQGVCGEIYLMSDSNDFSKHECGYTDAELESKGWSLKTETTKTDMTVSQLEKKCGLAAGSLNVVAE